MKRILKVVAALLVTGCGPKLAPLPPAQLTLQAAKPVAAPPFGEALAFGLSNGSALRALWMDADAVRFAALQPDGTWAATVTVAPVASPKVTAGRMPAIVEVEGGVLVALWFEKDGARRATSADGGATWSKPLALHPWLGGGEGEFSWIDPASATPSALWIGSKRWLPWAPETDGVLFASTDESGAIHAAWVLATRAASQSGVDGVRPGFGRLAAYRVLGEPTTVHEGEDAVVVVGLKQNGRADGRALVFRDGWKIPKEAYRIGPALDADGENVAAVWYAKVGAPEVKVTFSRNGGRTFPSGLKINVPETLWDLRVGYEGPQQVLVAWFTGGSHGRPVLVGRRVDSSGKQAGPLVILHPDPGAGAADLRVGRAGGKTWVGWTSSNGMHLAEVP